jgi:hypothetical protein
MSGLEIPDVVVPSVSRVVEQKIDQNILIGELPKHILDRAEAAGHHVSIMFSEHA